MPLPPVELLPLHDPTPWADPQNFEMDRLIREYGTAMFLGNRSPGLASMTMRARAVGLDWTLPGQENHKGVPLPAVEFVPGISLDLGNDIPDLAGGWEAPGLVNLSLLPGVALYAGAFVLRATPRLAIGVVPGVEPDLRIPDAWVGVDVGQARLGFGRESRWVGPGRFGNLLLSDNAVAPWMGSASGEATLPGKLKILGRFRAELGVGVLDRPRADVQSPGLLMMDFRYLPIPQVEIGLSRLSIFGGKDRPAVDLGQLLLPTEPHIYGDPDQL
ncbi:MAG TPA: capsule assembly Wzi family protein, partial [Myxococcota bacterium]|nr:capsule assembly Wzi family protein [Myxococcota bacterium]